MLDVFTSTPRQTLQMDSFYAAQDTGRVQPRLHPKICQQLIPYTPQFPLSHTNCASINNHGNIDTHVSSSGGVVQGGNNMNSGLTTPPTAKQPVLPPLRRIVKVAITPTVVTGVVICCALLNTLICIIVSDNGVSLLGTQWEIFVCLWGVVAMLQLVSHSVYLCTSFATSISLIHFAIVSATVILPARYISTYYIWLAPCLCVLIFTHQSLLYYLVYSHTKHKLMYVAAGAVLVFTPMTQLIQIGHVSDETATSCCTLSAISIYTLYVFAAINSYGSFVVDATVAPCPAWIPE